MSEETYFEEVVYLKRMADDIKIIRQQ